MSSYNMPAPATGAYDNLSVDYTILSLWIHSEPTCNCGRHIFIIEAANATMQQ
jgi:hypothetical protein